jgi:hypothetical protein
MKKAFYKEKDAVSGENRCAASVFVSPRSTYLGRKPVYDVCNRTRT